MSTSSLSTSCATPPLLMDYGRLGTATSSDEVSLDAFYSILWATPADTPAEIAPPPGCLHDLNLDQVISSIIKGREEYNLTPFFHCPLKNVEAVNFRYSVLRDLERDDVLATVRSFALGLRQMRTSLKTADKAYYPRERQKWILSAVAFYVDSVDNLHRSLSSDLLSSSGFRSFRAFLSAYVASDAYCHLATATRSLVSDLGQIRYSIHIDGRTITVSHYNGESDYGSDIVRTFAKFNQASTRKYDFASSGDRSVNHVEAAILDLVASLHPAIFSRLDEFCITYKDYPDRRLIAFDREIQFYVACLESLQPLKTIGLEFCYPKVADRRKDVFGSKIYDIALSLKLLREGHSVVTNDFFLEGQERILVISGPNQGGKTTFARTFGQLHYLASIGCPVPGNSARLFLFDTLFTHFEEEENVRSLTGKLEEELLRIRAILDAATARSILIMNESFASTTADDALLLSRKILQKIIDLDMLCVTVTFLEELASISAATVSMVSTVAPEDQSTRTYKVVRRAADGLAYARTIANKYRLTRSATKNRIIATMEHMRL